MKMMAFRLGVTLTVICAVTSLALSFTFLITNPRIEAAAEKKKKEAILSVIKNAESYEPVQTAEGEIYYRVLKGKELRGYALPVQAKGYSSTIEMMAGIDLRGKLTNLSVIKHEETPGLGARIVEIRPGEEEPWFTRQFRGKEQQQLDLKNIQAITGATISSRAVIEGVRQAVTEFTAEVLNEEKK